MPASDNRGNIFRRLSCARQACLPSTRGWQRTGGQPDRPMAKAAGEACGPREPGALVREGGPSLAWLNPYIGETYWLCEGACKYSTVPKVSRRTRCWTI